MTPELALEIVEALDKGERRIASPDGETSESFADRLLGHGVLVTPGSYLGPSGEGYARIALVPTEEECARGAAILERVL